MIDRRLVTDIGLAMLIAFPAALPAAPAPWNTDERAGLATPADERVEPNASVAELRDALQVRS